MTRNDNGMGRTLDGEIALVTGAAKRIGRATALELARAGADIVIHVNTSVAGGEETASEVRALGRRCAVVGADQRDPAAIGRACEEARAALGPVSILVNNASTWPQCDLETMTQEEYDAALEVNLRGPFFWARTLGLEMRRAGRGCIVNIADVVGDRPTTHSIPYCLAKAGVVTMTYALAKALAPRVRVNAIGPGPMIFPESYSMDAASGDIDRTLLKRRGSPDDIARAVRYLCEEGYITGILLPVDGGFRFGL